MANDKKPQIIWHAEERPESATQNQAAANQPQDQPQEKTKVIKSGSKAKKHRTPVNQSEHFDKLVKAIAIIYCVFVVALMFLPDAFTINQDLVSGSRIAYTVVRWFSFVPFIALPLAAFTDNRSIKNIAIYFTIIIVILQAVCVKQYMSDFTSSQGLGITSFITNAKVLDFLHNYKFRLALFIVSLTIAVASAILINIRDKHLFDVKNWKEWLFFVVGLLGIAVANIPIYILMHLFGVTEFVFRLNSAAQYAWFVVIAAEIVILYLAFRHASDDVKWIVLDVLAIANMCQFLQLYGAYRITLNTLPLSLCNITTFLTSISILSRNKRLFGVVTILNIVSCLFAVVSPIPYVVDKGVFYPTNIHYMAEHTALFVIPILTILYKLFPRFDKRTLLDVFISYSAMIFGVWVLGTAINMVYFRTGNLDWHVNWMFLFDSKVLASVAPFLKNVLSIRFRLGNATIYPVMQLGIYSTIMLLSVAIYFVIKLIYIIKDKLGPRIRRKR